MSPMQLDQAVRAHAPKGDAQPARTAAHKSAGSTLPPVMIYLPGLPKKEANSTSRIAELMTIKLNNGPGTFETEAVRSPSKHLSDGQRIVEAKKTPVLDLYMLDYRDRLQLVDVTGTGVSAAVRRFALALWYFLRAFALVLNAGAGRHAKRPVAKLQLLVGFGAVLVLLASVVFTVLAVLVSLGLWKDPFVTGNAADAIALGATAFTTWLFFSARPTILASAAQIEQFLDYAQNERYAAGVASVLDAALDDLLEAQPDRKVHLFGYSFGALVAMDYLYPRKSLLPTLDPRHAKAISTLVTVGCPINFVRLYISDYADNREARVENLRWINVFIPADVLGSNLLDDNDYTEKADKTTAVVQPAGLPALYRREAQLLEYLERHGFLQPRRLLGRCRPRELPAPCDSRGSARIPTFTNRNRPNDGTLRRPDQRSRDFRQTCRSAYPASRLAELSLSIDNFMLGQWPSRGYACRTDMARALDAVVGESHGGGTARAGLWSEECRRRFS